MNAAARQLVAKLGLAPLAREGGHFRVTARSASGSAMLYLLAGDDVSALHRIAQDEVWHFYAGDPIEHVQLDPSGGSVRVVRMSGEVAAGDAPQTFVAAGTWQGARIAARRTSAPASTESAPAARHGYALLGCTVSPPFDERGFELLARAEALRDFPSHAALMRALTR